MRRAGIEPAVEGVGLLREGLAAAVRAGKALRQKLRGFLYKPRVRSLGTEDLAYFFDSFGGADGLAAVLAVEYGDRQTPVALTRDAPVGALADHAGNALAAPLRQPLYALRGGDSLVLEGVNGAEPLVGGAEDDGILASPAVRVAVYDVLGGEDRVRGDEVCEDGRVRLEDLEALVLAAGGVEASVVIDVHDEVAAGRDLRIFAADVVVVRAVGRRGMNAAGTCVECDVLAENDERIALEERMARGHKLHLSSLEHGDGSDSLKSRLFENAVAELLRHDIVFAVRRLDHAVLKSRIEADRKVAGDSPGGGSPDDEVCVIEVHAAEQALIVRHAELYEDRGDLIVLVLDLSLGESGLVGGAPIDGLFALVDVALLVHLAEHLDLLGLELRLHSEIGQIPVAHKAEALELIALDIDEVLRKFVAGGAEFRDGHSLAVKLLLLYDGALNRHSVVIPAGREGRLVSRHGFIADDEILY